jgi:hypothetical protein
MISEINETVQEEQISAYLGGLIFRRVGQTRGRIWFLDQNIDPRQKVCIFFISGL